MAKVMDRDTIQFIMRSMTTNNRELQRRVADQFLTDDVKLVHVLGDVQGRDALYGVYRAAVTGLDYELLFNEMVVDEHMAACWVDLNLKLPPFFLRRYHLPTVVMLRFRHCEDGLIRICEQIDHHSVFVLMWALGWPFSAVWDLVVRRITGTMMSTSGWAVDTAEDATRAALTVGLKSSGWLLNQFLPEPLLDSLSQALPQGLVQQLGLSSGISSQPADGVVNPAVRMWEDVRAAKDAAAARGRAAEKGDEVGELSWEPLPVSSSSRGSSSKEPAAAGDGSAAGAAAAAGTASGNGVEWMPGPSAVGGVKPADEHDQAKPAAAAAPAAASSVLSSTVAGGSYPAAAGSYGDSSSSRCSTGQHSASHGTPPAAAVLERLLMFWI